MWPTLLIENEIFFAIKNFKWSNNARNKAGVICSIVGVRKISNKIKSLVVDNTIEYVNKITPYLTSEIATIVNTRSNVLSNLPKMVSGNLALFGGYFLLEDNEKNEILKSDPNSHRFILETTGGRDFLHDIKRWCLWIEDEDLNDALKIPEIKKRIEGCYSFRLNGGQVAKTLIDKSYQFRYRHLAKKTQIIIPQTTSENRRYIPFGFIDKSIVIQQSAQVLYDPPEFIFSILSSYIHMLWVKAVGSKHGFSVRYSPLLCYNTFPFPHISDVQKLELEKTVYELLNIREKYSEKTLAQLYDSDDMPYDLLQCHKKNDIIVERCYRSKPFENDEERLEYLFKLYEQMIDEEKSRGTLFETESKPKKKKK